MPSCQRLHLPGGSDINSGPWTSVLSVTLKLVPESPASSISAAQAIERMAKSQTMRQAMFDAAGTEGHWRREGVHTIII